MVQINSIRSQAVPELNVGRNDATSPIVGGFRFVNLNNVVHITQKSEQNTTLVADGTGPYRLDVLVGKDKRRLSIEFPEGATLQLLMGKLADAARKQGFNTRISNLYAEGYGNADQKCVVFDEAVVGP